MAKDVIVQEGDPVLRQVAVAVPKKDIGSPALQKILKKMHAALAPEKYGVAIAAPQIGESLRIFVVAGRVFKEESEEESEGHEKSPGGDGQSAGRSGAKDFLRDLPTPPNRVYINPEITRLSRAKKEMSEGCLSVRGKYGTVLRHEKATIKALNELGKPITYHGAGLIGHIFQHECDHLDGVLYTDKAVHLEEDEDMKGARQKLKDHHGI